MESQVENPDFGLFLSGRSIVDGQIGKQPGTAVTISNNRNGFQANMGQQTDKYPIFFFSPEESC
jgi:hypothetical protein